MSAEHQDQGQDQTSGGADAADTDDIKAKMRAALDRKQANDRGVPKDGPVKEKAHGSEIVGGGPRVHRRKAGGGGS